MKTKLALLVSLFVLELGSLKGQETSPNATKANDILGRTLKDQGYIEVPFITIADDDSPPQTPSYYVQCSIQNEKFLMKITISNVHSMFDLEFAKQLQKKFENQPNLITILDKGQAEHQVIHMLDFQVGTFSKFMRNTKKDFPNVMNCSTITKTAAEKKLRDIPYAGLISSYDLTEMNAIIDYPGRRMFVRNSFDLMWPKIEGSWKGINGTIEGNQLSKEQAGEFKFEFQDQQLTMNIQGKQLKYGVDIHKDGSRYTFMLYPAAEEKNPKVPYMGGGIFKVLDGKLHICLLISGATTNGFPTKFEAPEGSGLACMEFAKIKAGVVLDDK